MDREAASYDVRGGGSYTKSCKNISTRLSLSMYYLLSNTDAAHTHNTTSYTPLLSFTN